MFVRIMYVMEQPSYHPLLYVSSVTSDDYEEILADASKKVVASVVRDLVFSGAESIVVYDEEQRMSASEKRGYEGTDREEEHISTVVEIINNRANVYRVNDEFMVFFYTLSVVRSMVSDIGRRLSSILGRSSNYGDVTTGTGVSRGLGVTNPYNVFLPLVVDLSGLYDPVWVAISLLLREGLEATSVENRVFILVERYGVGYEPVTIQCAKQDALKLLHAYVEDPSVKRVVVKDYWRRTIFKAERKRFSRIPLINRVKILVNNIGYVRRGLLERLKNSYDEYLRGLVGDDYYPHKEDQLIFNFRDVKQFSRYKTQGTYKRARDGEH